MDEAEAKFGENGIEKRNSVEDPCVSTIVRTVPNLRAIRGVARLANPITRLLMPPKIGPVTSFARPYLRKAQPGIRGLPCQRLEQLRSRRQRIERLCRGSFSEECGIQILGSFLA